MFDTTKLLHLIASSIYFFACLFADEGKEFTQRMSAGCAFAILGFSIYSWSKIRQNVRGKESGRHQRRARSRSLSVTPTQRRRQGQETPDTKTPPQTLPGLKTPLAIDISTPSTRSTTRLRTPGSRILTPGGLV